MEMMKWLHQQRIPSSMLSDHYALAQRHTAKTYSEMVAGKGKATIISTSMTRGIRADVFNEEYFIEGRASFHRFHGGKAKHIRNQVETHLYDERPDTVIILAGGNDLPTRQRSPSSLVVIANYIIDIAMMCKKYDVRNICVTSVLPREDFYLQLRRKELNDILRSLSELYGFIFIDMDHGEDRIILSDHIDRDGVHLNSLGSEVLAHRFGSVLNRIHSC